MKYFYFFLLLTIFSCSDELTKSKAESIIEDCFDLDPNVSVVSILEGKTTFYYKNKTSLEKLEKMKSLQSQGFISLDSINGRKGRSVIYDIKILEKSKPFIDTNEKRDKRLSGLFGNKVSKYFRTCEYIIEDVLEVQEIPAMNGARVKLKLKKTNTTPFQILSKDMPDFKEKSLTLRKTSDGWKYCD